MWDVGYRYMVAEAWKQNSIDDLGKKSMLLFENQPRDR